MSNMVHTMSSRTVSVAPWRIAQRVATAAVWVMSGLVITVTALPVPLLFVVSSVPIPISGALVLADVGLLVALFTLKRTAILVTAVVAGIIAVSLLAIAASQFFASTPPITDAQGKVVPGSIATLEKVELNGAQEWITIRGKNANNPVLLFLAGGPGGSELAWTRKYLARLEDHFVVVNWDQPGCGKSYDAVPMASLTVDRYISDAYALTQLLRSRFHQEKIYLTGESGGTIWGIKLVQQHSELFYAWISGGGQMINTTQNDVMGYELALKEAAQRGDLKALDDLRRTGPPPYVGDGMFFKYVPYLSALNHYMYSHAAGDGQGGDRILDPIWAPEYGLLDKVNWFRGLIDVFTVVYPQLADLEFRTQASKLDVPVYFMEGRWDLNAMASLVQDYYDGLHAPHKELIWFENSGHDPLYEESGRFIELMVNHVLLQTPPDP